MALCSLDAGEHALVVLGHDLDELGRGGGPRREYLRRAYAAGELDVLRDQRAEFGEFGGLGDLVEADHLEVDALGEVAGRVEDIGDAARHAGREVAAGLAEDDHAPTGHVFATMIAHAFHHGGDAGVADAEALASHAADVDLATGGAVEPDVADDDVLLGREGGGGRGEDDELAAREALADVVVGIAFEGEGHALRHEGAEALAGGTRELDLDGVLGEALGAVLAGDLAPGNGADNTVDVANRQFGDDLGALVDRRLAEREELGEVEGLVEAVVLRGLAETTDLGAGVRLVEDAGEVQALGLPVFDGLAGFEAIGAADHLLDGAEAELGHELADFLRDEAHEGDDVLGLALELLA